MPTALTDLPLRIHLKGHSLSMLTLPLLDQLRPGSHRPAVTLVPPPPRREAG